MKKSGKNRKLAINMLAIVAGMFMLAYASVPLYRVFCKVTGYGGTTQEAKQLPKKKLNKKLTITFNADVDRDLPWKFVPDQHKVSVKIGEQKLISYYAENLTDKPIKGMSTFNVIPEAAGKYFNKIQCFCFEEQILQPKQKVHMPVSFFIDPEIVNDKIARDIKTITLSYTFFKVKE